VTTTSLLLFAYNHEAFIEAALLSALRQDLAAYEVIVVDDASGDRTRAIIEEILAREEFSGRLVRTIFHERNQGVLAAVNAAMAMATGEIFLMMAGDDISMPNRLRCTEAIFEENPKVQLVYGEVEIIDEQGRLLCPVRSKGCARQSTYSFRRYGRIYAGALPCGASAAYRRRLYDVFGPMGVGSHAEDNCYWVRALLLGVIHHDPACFVQWRRHGANLSNFHAASEADWRSRQLSFMSNHARMSPQWLADVATAREQGLISPLLAFHVRYAARKEDATWALWCSSMRPDPWSQWARLAWAMVLIGRLTTTLKMIKLRISPSAREKKWQEMAKLKSNPAA
jgi:hypothetical protein